MTASISGLGSGIDFGALVDQLMQIEKQPVTRLQATITKQQTKISALSSISSKMAAITSAANKLSSSYNFMVMKATSSNESAVTASTTNSALTSSISFTVDSTAKSLSQVSSNTITALTDTVSTGPVSINGQAVNIGDGSLQALVNGINANAATGVRAAAVKVAPNQYRLQLTSTNTGAAGAITIVGAANLAALGTLNVAQAGSDAQITIGSGPGAYSITSASNTISDVLPGVTLTVKQTSASPVTIDTAADGTSIATNIQALVDTANLALAEIATQTKITAGIAGGATTGAALSGDYATQQLAGKVLNAVAYAITGSSYGSAGLVGVSTTQTGQIKFDQAKFLSTFAADPVGVSRMFTSGGGATDPRVTFLSAPPNTAAGSYAVSVTQAASLASTTGMAGVVTVGASNRITVVSGSTTVDYDTVVGNTMDQVRDGLNSALSAGGITSVTASNTGSALQLSSNFYGAAATFQSTFAGPGGLTTQTGTDVLGTIGGFTSTGTGQSLAVTDPTSNIFGLALQITATPAQISGATSLGTFDYSPGIASRLEQVVKNATNSVTGSLTTSKASWQTLIDRENKTIENMNYQLGLREKRLRSQYASLDALLGTLKAQQSQLESQIAQLPR